jgi:hypothetical protein
LSRNLQLGTHAIGACHQYGSVVATHLEQAGKAAATVEYLRSVSAGGKTTNAVFQLVHAIKVDT